MKKLLLLLLLCLGFTGAANGHHSYFHKWYDPSAVYYAEISCEAQGSAMGLHVCVEDQFLKLTKNNITKTYHTNDFYVNRPEVLMNCGWTNTAEVGCFFDLPEHFTIRVWRGDQNDGFAKLVLKIFNQNGDILYQDETSRRWTSMAVSN